MVHFNNFLRRGHGSGFVSVSLHLPYSSVDCNRTRFPLCVAYAINVHTTSIDCSPALGGSVESSDKLQRYPRLSKMALDILFIPAMSVEPERVFSGARRTIS
jgi:hAT family C-terminal dimerisation region